MTGEASAQPLRINPGIATAAQMYDYWLGGHDNFAAGRIAALKVMAAAPEAPQVARHNRAFLGRAVTYLAGSAGISQFLDLGTGTCASYCVPSNGGGPRDRLPGHRSACSRQMTCRARPSGGWTADAVPSKLG